MPYPGIGQVTFDDDFISGGDGAQSLRVDTESPGFSEGRQFRIGYEFDFTVAETVVIEAVIGVDTKLTKSELNVDQGGVRYSIVAGGTGGGTFSESIPVLPKNTMSTVGSYTSQLTFTAGGTVSGGTELPIARARSASGNNARASALAGGTDARGFGVQTLYLVLEPLPGVNDDCLGLLNLEWEEYP